MADDTYICKICHNEFDASDTYEYRGAYSCLDHVDQMRIDRDFERSQIIEEESNKTKVFSGLDISPDTPIGKANRDTLKPQLEIASKEPARVIEYERGTDHAKES